MQATGFEFRFRFLIIVGIYILGFWCYAVDPVNVAVMLGQRVTGHPFEPSIPGDRHMVQAILAVGASLAVIAALVRTWAAAYLQSEVVHDSRIHAEGLVAEGPYRYVRNPLYLGGILLAVGFGLAASRLGFVVIVGGLTLFFFRLIAREESQLSQTQGEPYRQFLTRVPRLFPSFSPRIAAGGVAPKWGQAVYGEIFMWFFVAADLCFAVTLNRRLFLTLIVCGLAGSVAAKVALRRKEHSPI